MGEIFHALEVLNRSMNLGLNGKQLLRAEMGFKSALAMQGNPDPVARQLAADPGALAEQFEIVATLRPRAQKVSLNELSNLAAQAIKSPRTNVDATTFTKIDRAIGLETRVSPNVGTKLNPAIETKLKTGVGSKITGQRAAAAKAPKKAPTKEG